MYLHIDDNMTVEEVQERFSDCFPYLAIAFYSTGHKRFAPSDKRYQYEAKERIGNIRKNHNMGALEIKSWHTVDKVERELRELYGLHAQVFRLGNDGVAVQTTRSDSLTLKQQSEMAVSAGMNMGPRCRNERLRLSW